jgi:hypothetical protein
MSNVNYRFPGFGGALYAAYKATEGLANSAAKDELPSLAEAERGTLVEMATQVEGLLRRMSTIVERSARKAQINWQRQHLAELIEADNAAEKALVQ